MSADRSSHATGPRTVAAPGQGGASSEAWWAAPWLSGSNEDPDAGWAEQKVAASPAGHGDTLWHANLIGGQDYGTLLAPLERDLGQVRSRDRVRDLAEVFTNQREIDAMLALIPDAFDALDVKFLEPACGSGNFLTEVLRRKLGLVSKPDCVSQEQYEHRLLRAVASVYGIDISMENVVEGRSRMAHALLEHYQADANTIEPTPGFLNAVAIVLGANVVLGDALNDANRIEMCDWRPYSGGRFQRVWSFALIPQAERDLFWSERIQDIDPVHYAQMQEPQKPARPERKVRAGQ